MFGVALKSCFVGIIELSRVEGVDLSGSDEVVRHFGRTHGVIGHSGGLGDLS